MRLLCYLYTTSLFLTDLNLNPTSRTAPCHHPPCGSGEGRRERINLPNYNFGEKNKTNKERLPPPPCEAGAAPLPTQPLCCAVGVPTNPCGKKASQGLVGSCFAGAPTGMGEGGEVRRRTKKIFIALFKFLCEGSCARTLPSFPSATLPLGGRDCIPYGYQGSFPSLLKEG